MQAPWQCCLLPSQILARDNPGLVDYFWVLIPLPCRNSERLLDKILRNSFYFFYYYYFFLTQTEWNDLYWSGFALTLDKEAWDLFAFSE